MFVDLERSGSSPGFFVVPDEWVRRDIHVAHQEYLRRHGGKRVVTQDSVHHAIRPNRVVQWRDRWDLLGL